MVTSSPVLGLRPGRADFDLISKFPNPEIFKSRAGLEAIGELIKGDAVDQIVKYATSIEAELIMLGHKRHGNWLERWWRSSTPKALIEHSPCSVLVVIVK